MLGIVKYNRARFLSSILALLIFTTFIGGKMYFINVGISIRPFYVLLLMLSGVVVLGTYRKKEFLESNIPFMGYTAMLILGVAAYWLTSIKVVQEDVIRNVIFMVVQCLVFFSVSTALLQCDDRLLAKKIIGLAPWIAIPALALFSITTISNFGTINSILPGVFFGLDGIPRATGLFDDPNYFSLYILSYLYISIIIIDRYNITLSAFKKISLFLCLFCVILTSSRMAYGVIALFLFLNAFTNRKFYKFIPVIVFVAVVIFIAIINIDDQFLDIFTSKFTDMENDGGSTNERVELMALGLQSPITEPFGCGLSNSPNYFMKFYGMPKLPHNDWLTVLVECGVLGGLIYVVIWLRLFILTKKTIIRIAIICFMLHISSLSLYSYEPMLPIFISYIFYLGYILPQR